MTPRRHRAAIALVSTLLAAGIVAWAAVFLGPASDPTTGCNPSTVSGAGVVQSPSALDEQPAAAPQDVRVTVLNGTSRRGQARLAAVELAELGIVRTGRPDVDRLYPSGDLTCVGQIRFGSRGAAAARTMSLVVPCAQLVRDDRADATIDLALGSRFRTAVPSRTAIEALRGLARSATENVAGSPAPDLRPTGCDA